MRAAGAGVPAVSLRAEVRQLTCDGPYRIRNPERTADCRYEKTSRSQRGVPSKPSFSSVGKVRSKP